MGPIGRTDQLVTFETPTSVPDSEGGYLDTWAPLDPATWYVSIRSASVRDLERLTAGTVLAQASHILEGWYHPGVTIATRVRWTDYAPDGTSHVRTLHVAGVDNPDRRDEHMRLFCEERIDASTPAAAVRRPGQPSTTWGGRNA
jgi:head-tail adaptor